MKHYIKYLMVYFVLFFVATNLYAHKRKLEFLFMGSQVMEKNGLLQAKLLKGFEIMEQYRIM